MINRIVGTEILRVSQTRFWMIDVFLIDGLVFQSMSRFIWIFKAYSVGTDAPISKWTPKYHIFFIFHLEFGFL